MKNIKGKTKVVETTGRSIREFKNTIEADEMKILKLKLREAAYTIEEAVEVIDKAGIYENNNKSRQKLIRIYHLIREVEEEITSGGEEK